MSDTNRPAGSHVGAAVGSDGGAPVGAQHAELRRRQPSIDAAGAAMLRQLVEHPDAPAWNHVAGDRLQADDLAWLDALRADLAQRTPTSAGPDARLLSWLADRLPQTPLLRERVAGIDDLDAGWATIPTSGRADLALRLEDLVPDDAPLDEMLVYSTAGTTGHPLRVPHHARGVAAYLALIEVALRRWGIELDLGPGVVGAMLLGAQRSTVTYPCVLAGWGNVGFAKINLDPDSWPRVGAAGRYLRAMAPRLLTGDPISFAELLRQDVVGPMPARERPRALLSTAVAMSSTLRTKLRSELQIPVIDWYSLTETGPIAFACPASDDDPVAMHLLGNDLYVEILGADGHPVPDGEVGEVVVSGGRNRYLPLLRYRTGDWAAMRRDRCGCGEPTARLVGLQGRQPVLFVSEAGTVVNPVDLARGLRPFAMLAHEVEQDACGEVRVRVRALPDQRLDLEGIGAALRALLGSAPGGVALDLREDPTLGSRGDKPQPWRSAMRLDDLLRPPGQEPT